MTEDRPGVIEIDTGCDVRALFTTRTGGVSTGPFAALNLSTAVGDDPAAVAVNRDRVSGLAGLAPGRLATLNQVHGADVVTLEGPPATPPAADGAVTGAAGLGLMVMAADCVPLLFWREDGGAIGAAHAGWRGLMAGVITATVTALGGRTAPVAAAIGPSIGRCCYEVSAEVADRFRDRFGAGIVSDRRVDLRGAALVELIEAGVDPGTIAIVDECTCCLPERYFSHRGSEGRCGRQSGMVWR